MVRSKVITLVFSECEHEGDIHNYAQDVRSAGGKVVGSKMCQYSYEQCEIRVEVVDKAKFFEKFKKTNAFEMSQYGY